MSHRTQAIVIDHGSYSTKAGFSLEYLPSMVIDSNYLVDEDGKVSVGREEVEKHPENEIMTLMDDGNIYNFDNLDHVWKHVYDNVDNGQAVSSKEHPLVVTEQTWNSASNKAKLAQKAFETFEVPLFSLVKKPQAQLYAMGRSSGLVVDVGAAVASVTPILDGTVQTNASFHSKYAGDFVNLQILKFLESCVTLDNLVPKKFRSCKMSPSFMNYQISYNVLDDFKASMLQISEVPVSETSSAVPLNSYQLPNKLHVPIKQEQTTLAEALFEPKTVPLKDIYLPEPSLIDPPTNGISKMILLALKNLESAYITANDATNSAHYNSSYAKFNEVLKELLGNIVITGGTSLASGFTQRVLNDIYRLANQFFPNYLATQPGRLIIGTLGNYQQNDINEVWDKSFDSWFGACNLANMLRSGDLEGAENVNVALENWFVTKSDYEEFGEDLILEKFK